jgi:hypothetical protein
MSVAEFLRTKSGEYARLPSLTVGDDTPRSLP